MVTAAWFPRDLRLQLRRPPTLQPPVIDGVWSYPQAAPVGHRRHPKHRRAAYDLFVAHQVVFPLVPGTMTIPRAMLKYSTPVALQFFSQEERFALTSRAETLVVRPLPTEGRPADFSGAVGSGLTIERRITPQAAKVGEGITVELTPLGRGQYGALAAAGDPLARGIARLQRSGGRAARATEGRIGGTKIFRYLVVPDSVGALTLPATMLRLLRSGRRDRTLESRCRRVASRSLPATEAAASAALPPGLIGGSAQGLARRLVGRVAASGSGLRILVLPPALLALRRTDAGPASAPGSRERDRSRQAEEELDAVLGTLGAGSRPSLGRTAPGRDHAPRVPMPTRRAGRDGRRNGCSRDGMGPRDRVPRIPPSPPRSGPGAGSLGGSLRAGAAAARRSACLRWSVSRAVVAQSPSPEELYREGSLARPPRDSRAGPRKSPMSAPTGTISGRRSIARARRDAPRRRGPRRGASRHARRGPIRALRLTPPPDAASARWTWSPPVTPEELLLFGSLAWIAGWIGWALRPRLRERWLVLLVFGGLGVGGWSGAPRLVPPAAGDRARSHLGTALASRTGSRVAPLEPGGAVRILGHVPGWVLVRHAGDQQGWVADAAVARIGG